MNPRTPRFHCPCCGYAGLERNAYAWLAPPPWDDLGSPPYCTAHGEPSYEVCGCCGFEFGNDDDPGTAPGDSFETYRQAWLAHGADWFDPSRRPAGWDPDEQLAVIGIGVKRIRGT